MKPIQEYFSDAALRQRERMMPGWQKEGNKGFINDLLTF